MTELLTAWRHWEPKAPPYILPGDETVLCPLNRNARSRRSVLHDSWREYVGAPNFGAAATEHFHLGLLPVPFAGALRTARVVILLLNPGLLPIDHFAEATVPAFRARLLANLRQDFSDHDHPFLYLDPTFAWHPGFGWWHAKLRGVIGALASHWNMSFAQARHVVSQHLAMLELVPYHSERFRLSPRLLGRLLSATLAREYVRDVLAPKAAMGRALLVIGRQARVWQIAPSENVVVYSGAEARAAHLTLKSEGGRRIVEALSDIMIPHGAV
jgi:hypothetical protein